MIKELLKEIEKEELTEEVTANEELFFRELRRLESSEKEEDVVDFQKYSEEYTRIQEIKDMKYGKHTCE